jgi:hypothetical protein
MRRQSARCYAAILKVALSSTADDSAAADHYDFFHRWTALPIVALRGLASVKWRQSTIRKRINVSVEFAVSAAGGLFQIMKGKFFLVLAATLCKRHSVT